MSKSAQVFQFFKHPYLTFFLLVASSAQGVLIIASFSLFQIKHLSIETYSLMFIGLILAYLIGMFFGLNINNRNIKNALILLAFIQSMLILLIGIFFDSNVTMTVILYMFFSFVSGFVSLYNLSRIHYSENIEERIRHSGIIVFIWFAGQALFGLIFVFSSNIAFIYASIASFIGSISFYFLINQDSITVNFTQVNLPLKEIFTPNNLSLVLLFTIYGAILFSFITFFSQTNYFMDFHSDATIANSIWLGTIITAITALIWVIINHRMSLRTTYTIIYVIVVFSVLTYIFNKDLLPYTFILDLLVWSFFAIFIFTNFEDLYPYPKNIQVLALWWLSLTFAFGGGILLPLIITETDVLLYIYLIVTLLSIFLLSYLRTITEPLKIYHLLIFTPTGMPIYSRGYIEVEQVLISGLLSGIMSMFKEVFSSDSTLRFIDHGDKKLLIARSQQLIGVLLTNIVEYHAIHNLKDIVESFELTFHKELKIEPFKMSTFDELPPLLLSKLDIFQK